MGNCAPHRTVSDTVVSVAISVGSNLAFRLSVMVARRTGFSERSFDFERGLAANASIGCNQLLWVIICPM